MRGLKIKIFDGVGWTEEGERDTKLEAINKFVNEHDVKQIMLSDFSGGFRGFILYKPSKSDKK